MMRKLGFVLGNKVDHIPIYHIFKFKEKIDYPLAVLCSSYVAFLKEQLEQSSFYLKGCLNSTLYQDYSNEMARSSSTDVVL